jgi:hypothetical protein
VPGGEEIDAGPEPGLQDDESIAPRPALGDAGAAEEHVACLADSAAGAVIDVVESLRVRGTLFGEPQTRRDEGFGHEAIVKV